MTTTDNNGAAKCDSKCINSKIKCESEGRRSDGCSVASLVRDFRNELHTNVQMAIAAGCGEMLRRVGHFWEKGRG